MQNHCAEVQEILEIHEEGTSSLVVQSSCCWSAYVFLR